MRGMGPSGAVPIAADLVQRDAIVLEKFCKLPQGRGGRANRGVSGHDLLGPAATRPICDLGEGPAQRAVLAHARAPSLQRFLRRLRAELGDMRGDRAGGAALV